MSKDWLDELDTEETEAQGAEASQPDKQEAEPEQPEQAAEAPEPAKAEDAGEGGEENSQPPDDDQPVNRGQLAALLAEREKRQQFEREREAARQEAERYRRELEELRQSQTNQTQETIPDPIDDGQGFQNWTMTQAQQAALSAKLELSEDMVRRDIGDETFEAVQKWWAEETRRKPHLVQEGIRQRNPWRYAYSQYQKNQFLSEVGEDPQAYKERLRNELLAELQAQQSPEQPKTEKQTPPPSLAKGGAGGASDAIANLSEDEFFASTFKR